MNVSVNNSRTIYWEVLINLLFQSESQPSYKATLKWPIFADTSGTHRICSECFEFMGGTSCSKLKPGLKIPPFFSWPSSKTPSLPPCPPLPMQPSCLGRSKIGLAHTGAGTHVVEVVATCCLWLPQVKDPYLDVRKAVTCVETSLEHLSKRRFNVSETWQEWQHSVITEKEIHQQWERNIMASSRASVGGKWSASRFTRECAQRCSLCALNLRCMSLHNCILSIICSAL